VREALQRLWDRRLLILLTLPPVHVSFLIDDFGIRGVVLLASWTATAVAILRLIPMSAEKRQKVVTAWAACAAICLIMFVAP
jgi:hypothetical protein